MNSHILDRLKQAEPAFIGPVENNPDTWPAFTNKQYYDELYKNWGGVEGLQKLRAENKIDPSISYRDMDTPFMREVAGWGGMSLNEAIPKFNPYNSINSDTIKVGMEPGYVGTGIAGRSGMTNNGYKAITLNPQFMDGSPDTIKQLLSHEIGHTYQPSDETTYGRWNDSNERAYNINPMELMANMSAAMPGFIKEYNTPVYNNQTSNKFLDYIKHSQKDLYDKFREAEMTDEQIKNLSKKIVSNDTQQQPKNPVYRGTIYG